MPNRLKHKYDGYEEVLRSLERQGWRVVTSKKNYYKMHCPNPCRCIGRMPSTPSGARTLANIVSELKRTCWEAEQ